MLKLYMRMAATNLRTNHRLYTPYILACSFVASMYYMVGALLYNEKLAELRGADTLRSYLGMGKGILALFAIIFIFYVNSFLVKRRQKEFGLYAILGMEKRHINTIILFETIYTFMISCVAGFVIGFFLDKLMYLTIMKVLGNPDVMGFYVSYRGILDMAALLAAIFLLIQIKAAITIRRTNPIDLLSSEEAGETEPKSKWILAVLGVLCIGIGYAIAIVTQNAVAAVFLFFIAVALVVIGTYLTFTAGSIVFLKILRRNKKYYYKTNHFISVSSMLYRMKKNAVGLANICILSTMVIIMLSSTLNIFVGANDALNKRYPKEFVITASEEHEALDSLRDELGREIDKAGLAKEGEVYYKSLTIGSIYDKNGNFEIDYNQLKEFTIIELYNNLCNLMFVTLDDYNASMGTNYSLADREDVLLYTNKAKLDGEWIQFENFDFHVREELDDFMTTPNALVSITSTFFVVVKDESVIEDIYEAQAEALGGNASRIEYTYMTDVSGIEKEKSSIKLGINKASEEDSDYEAVAKSISHAVREKTGADNSGFFSCKSEEAETFHIDFYGLYFLGFFLGSLFILATVLIIYYKQITEGYEDKARFEILQNVGLSHEEVKKTINSQILTVFFLPLVTAGIHTAVAFPFIFRIMTLLGMFNMKLFAICTLTCFAIFGVFYIIVYKATAGAYYRIVKH